MEIKGDGMDENILNQLQELFKGNNESFTIIEEKIDIDLQMEYFKISKSVKEKTLNSEEILDDADKLYDETIAEEDKKKLLNNLASLEDVEAYRIIEHFYKFDKNPIKEWTALALRESKMMMETSLLDEKQILISTGLGGKGHKLRYFIVLVTKEDTYTESQQKLISSELDFALNKNNSEIENIEFEQRYAKITSLIPLQSSVKQVLNTAVEECNQYGDFIEKNFIITNVKEFSTEEINEFIDKKNSSLDDEPDELDL